MSDDEWTVDELMDLAKRSPMRVLQRRRCKNGHEWVQPARTGNCPTCGTAVVKNLDTRVSTKDRR